jgi:hypothetical protein
MMWSVSNKYLWDTYAEIALGAYVEKEGVDQNPDVAAYNIARLADALCKERAKRIPVEKPCK